MKNLLPTLIYLKNILKNHSYLIFMLLVIYIKSAFNYDILTYIYQLPSTILSGILLLYLGFIIYFSVNKKTQKTESKELNTIAITSQNDVSRKNSSPIFGTLIILGILVYICFEKTFTLNIGLVLVIVLISTFTAYTLHKTASFKLINGRLHYKNEKEERSFEIVNITTIDIYRNQIIINQEYQQHVISFLELSEQDFKELKSWFNKQLPEIEIKRKVRLIT